MTQSIGQLTATTTVQTSDQFVVYSAADQDTRRAPGSQVLAWLQAVLSLSAVGVPASTQYAAPSATAFSVTVALADSWLVLTPTGAFAAGTIVLPAVRIDRQIVRVSCTQAVTALTVSGAGTTVTGAPTTLAADAFFSMQYDNTTAAWYRVN